MAPETLSTLRVALIAFALVALAASLVERLALTIAQRAYDWREALASLAVAIVRRLTDLLPLAIAMPGGGWLYEHRLVSARSRAGSTRRRRTASITRAWNWRVVSPPGMP